MDELTYNFYNQLFWLMNANRVCAICRRDLMRKRERFNEHQVNELEKQYQLNKYISMREREELARALNLTKRQVATWFQNRRNRKKND